MGEVGENDFPKNYNKPRRMAAVFSPSKKKKNLNKMSQIQQVSDDMNNSRTTSSYTTQHLVLQAVTFQLSKQ